MSPSIFFSTPIQNANRSESYLWARYLSICANFSPRDRKEIVKIKNLWWHFFRKKRRDFFHNEDFFYLLWPNIWRKRRHWTSKQCSWDSLQNPDTTKAYRPGQLAFEKWMNDNFKERIDIIYYVTIWINLFNCCGPEIPQSQGDKPTCYK